MVEQKKTQGLMMDKVQHSTDPVVDFFAFETSEKQGEQTEPAVAYPEPWMRGCLSSSQNSEKEMTDDIFKENTHAFSELDGFFYSGKFPYW